MKSLIPNTFTKSESRTKPKKESKLVMSAYGEAQVEDPGENAMYNTDLGKAPRTLSPTTAHTRLVLRACTAREELPTSKTKLNTGAQAP